MSFSNKKNQSPLQKWLILGLQQEMYMKMEHLVMLESKQVLKRHTGKHEEVGHVEGTLEPT
jgi:hypothetical protein